VYLWIKFDVVTHVGRGLYLGQPCLPSQKCGVPVLPNFAGSPVLIYLVCYTYLLIDVRLWLFLLSHLGLDIGELTTSLVQLRWRVEEDVLQYVAADAVDPVVESVHPASFSSDGVFVIGNWFILPCSNV